MKPPVFTLLMLILCCCVLSCKGAPAAIEDDSGEDEFSSYEDTDLGGWIPDDLGGDDSDEPSLSLPPASPPGGTPPDLPEPSFEYGEAFFPGVPPEEAAMVWTLPEPGIPETDLAEDNPTLPEGPVGPPETDLAEDIPEEPVGPPSSPSPPPPPPPSRLVRPSEPIPPPPPVRVPIPLPVNPIPDPPALSPISAVPSRPSPAPSPPGPSSSTPPPGTQAATPSLTPVVPAPAGSPVGQPALGEASSRMIQAVAGQTLEIPFRGTGWVYLGEAASQRGVSYTSRRLDSEGQTFILRADEPGTYELRFYRQDFIRDYIINDMVKLIVEAAPLAALPFGVPLDRGRVIAEPRWPILPGAQPGPVGPSAAGVQPAPAGASVTGAAPAASAGQSSRPNRSGEAIPPVPPVSRGSPELSRTETAGTGAAGSNTPGSAGTGSAGAEAGGIEARGAPPPEAGLADTSRLLPGDTPPEEYLRQAQAEYDAGRVPQALNMLDQFRNRFPLGSDEAWWLYGQYYEAAGSARNIRSSLEYYRRLVNEYPQSPRYTDAKRRIAYLERYYINIQ